jgi:hypothetical protein
MEELGVFVIVIVVFFVFGVVGFILGTIVEKEGAGFFLGLFLGPVGWVIVLLLPRVVETTEVSIAQKTGPRIKTARPKRNLESDDYKLWLSKTYNIQKNDLFEKYEFDESLFATLDDVLTYVDQKDRDKETLLYQAQREAELELVKTKQEEAEKAEKAEKENAKAAKVFPKF